MRHPALPLNVRARVLTTATPLACSRAKKVRFDFAFPPPPRLRVVARVSELDSTMLPSTVLPRTMLSGGKPWRGGGTESRTTVTDSLLFFDLDSSAALPSRRPTLARRSKRGMFCSARPFTPGGLFLYWFLHPVTLLLPLRLQRFRRDSPYSETSLSLAFLLELALLLSVLGIGVGGG